MLSVIEWKVVFQIFQSYVFGHVGGQFLNVS